MRMLKTVQQFSLYAIFVQVFVDHGCGVEWRMRKTIIVLFSHQIRNSAMQRNKIRPYFFLLAFNSTLRRIPTNSVRYIKTALLRD